MYLSFVNCRLITAAVVVYWNVFSKKNICVALGLILFTFLFTFFYNFHHFFFQFAGAPPACRLWFL